MPVKDRCIYRNGNMWMPGEMAGQEFSFFKKKYFFGKFQKQDASVE